MKSCHFASHSRCVVWQSLLMLGVVAVLGMFVTQASAQDLRLPLLKTKTGEYTNVTVTSKSSTEVYIMHAGGVQNIKVHELDEEGLVQLGYEPPRDRKKEAEAKVAEIESRILNSIPVGATTTDSDDSEAPAPPQRSWSDVLNAISLKNLSVETISENLFELGMFLFFYLGIVSCYRTICIKAGYKPGFTIYLPIMQVVPIFRAAGMGVAWVMMFLSPLLVALAVIAAVPLIMAAPSKTWLFSILGAFAFTGFLHLIASIMWCVRIVKARGKSGWIALFLILPFTSFFAFCYLVFSSGVEQKENDSEPPPLPSSGGKFVVGAKA